MENDYTVKMDTMGNDFLAVEDGHDEITHPNPDNSLSKAALIAYLLS